MSENPSYVRDAVASAHAPKAIGPYSQAVRAGGMLYCSGQIALDPETGEMVSGGVGPQTDRVLDNLEAVLAEAGVNWSHVVRCTIYLKSLGDFTEVNERYGKRFQAPYPARVTIEAPALPKGSLVEIDAIAVLPKA